jgi:hypothetical protein
VPVPLPVPRLEPHEVNNSPRINNVASFMYFIVETLPECLAQKHYKNECIISHILTLRLDDPET